MTDGAVSGSERSVPPSSPSMNGGTYRPPFITIFSAVFSSALLDRLGTKPMAPRSMARMTSLERSDADTTTTGSDG